MKGKIKYYLKKPKSEIIKDLMFWLAVSGSIVIAASSPFFVQRLLQKLSAKHKKTYNTQSFRNAFYRLKREGYLNVQTSNHQIYISLTPEGRKKAGRFQINHLTIARPAKWDGKWRVIVFDIKHKQRIKREALRGFIKRLGFYQLQKSVWVHPYDCRPEVELLKEFFGFTTRELNFLLVNQIEDDERLRAVFQL
jgi:DNA-binding transcriptional regulator PaaX